jgi:hypothetical protein
LLLLLKSLRGLIDNSLILLDKLWIFSCLESPRTSSLGLAPPKGSEKEFSLLGGGVLSIGFVLGARFNFGLSFN